MGAGIVSHCGGAVRPPGTQRSVFGEGTEPWVAQTAHRVMLPTRRPLATCGHRAREMQPMPVENSLQLSCTFTIPKLYQPERLFSIQLNFTSVGQTNNCALINCVA